MDLVNEPCHLAVGGAAGTVLPPVSVVFLAHNRKPELQEALRRMVSESGYPRDKLEVVVVDNNSDDGTVAMVHEHFPDVRVVRNARNLGAPGWNAGFKIAGGDYILILDDDAYLPPGGLEQAVTSAQEDDADLVSFTVVSSLEPGSRFTDSYRTGLLSYWGCAALVSRRALSALGGYDPNIFIWANELDFTMRLLDHGFRHLFLPEVEAVHMKRLVIGFDPLKHRMRSRHFAYVAAKSMRPRDALAVLTNMAMSQIVDVFVESPSAVRALLQIPLGLADGLRHRQRVRSDVSAAYRKNYRSFASPWRFMRQPAERLRSRRQDRLADTQRAQRQQAYFDERPEFFPTQRASLKI